LYVTNEDGAHLEIKPDPDAPTFGIILHTPDEKSKQWFGDIRLLLSHDEASALGKALTEFADQFDKDNA
jgi:hypothetical protein